MRSVDEIQSEAGQLHQEVAAIRAKLVRMVAALRARRETDQWAAAEDMTLLDITVVEEEEVPKSYWHHGLLASVEEDLMDDLEESLHKAATSNGA